MARAGAAGPWGARAGLGPGSRREPLVSGVCSLKGASGLPGVSGCFWRLWEGPWSAGVGKVKPTDKSAPETDRKGRVIALKG